MLSVQDMGDSLQNMLLELNSFSFNSQSYGWDDGAAGFSIIDGSVEGSRTDSRDYEKERIEVLLLYLRLIGVGTDYKGSRESVHNKISELLVKKDNHDIIELDNEIRVISRGDKKTHHDVFEPVFSDGNYLFELYRDEKRTVIVEYYVSPARKDKKQEEGFYVYTPSGLRVVRASEGELGKGVLGVAYIGLGLIKILDNLYGQEYQEVLKHEVLHHQYPHEAESSIRKMTMNALPYPTKYQ
jgi:hypothetical protein